tara:strand:- start:161 stop:577 length:417 start_codon:yes stop_codon:yes gene_type:complete
MRQFRLPILFLVALLSGCATYVGLHQPEKLMVPQGHATAETIQTAIRTGASKQGWKVVDEGANYLIVSSEPYWRARYPVIQVSYSLYAVEFDYVSSRNLRYTYVTEGKQLVRRDYNKMVNGLVQAIRYEIQKSRRTGF